MISNNISQSEINICVFTMKRTSILIIDLLILVDEISDNSQNNHLMIQSFRQFQPHYHYLVWIRQGMIFNKRKRYFEQTSKVKISVRHEKIPGILPMIQSWKRKLYKLRSCIGV